jgi:ribonuclease HI
MLTTEDFIEKGMSGFTLNKAQFEILGLSYPPSKGWETTVINKNISQDEANLFILLKGKLALKAQKQIIKNYQLMLEFNNEIQDNKKEIQINEFDIIKIYCDGACINNPGNAGSGLCVYKNDNNPVLLYGAYTELGTNNTAELNAFYKALLIASESKASKITIFSDSQYSIDCITKWSYGWKNKGWTKKGGEIKNLEIIKISHELYDMIKDKINIEHVKAHIGIEGNELADRMGMVAIRSKNKEFKEFSYSSIEEILNLTAG